MARMIISDNKGNGVIFEKSTNEKYYHKSFLIDGARIALDEVTTLYYIGQTIRRMKDSGGNYNIAIG